MYVDKKAEMVIKKFRTLSEKYHQLSFLLWELSRSLEIEYKHSQNPKKFKESLKKLNIDIDKLSKISSLDNIMLNDIQKENKHA